MELLRVYAAVWRRCSLEVSPASWASSADLGPRWVRVATVQHRQQRSPAVANGPEEPQVIDPAARVAGMMRRGDSDCGPEGHRHRGGRSRVAGLGASTVDVAPAAPRPLRNTRAIGRDCLHAVVGRRQRWRRPTMYPCPGIEPLRAYPTLRDARSGGVGLNQTVGR